jgi:hypothetical protein
LDNLGGTLSVSKGGTGASTLTSGNFVVGNGTGAVSTTKVVPTGDVVGTTDSQTLTNKTLTAPVISTITNTGTLTLPTSTDTLVGRATTDTLTNKTLTAPVISTITNTGTLTLPTSTDTLVGRATTDTLTNKSLVDSTTTIIDNLDNTKQMQFQLSGITTATTRTLTVPDASTTLVGTDVAQTLTNKTIIDNTNNVATNSLKTTGAVVNVSSAAPPSTGQVLMATSATTATWQTPVDTGITSLNTKKFILISVRRISEICYIFILR